MPRTSVKCSGPIASTRSSPTREQGSGSWAEDGLSQESFTSYTDMLHRKVAEALRPVASVHVVSECPQVYTAGKSKGDPNDLIELAGVVGRVAGALGASSELSYLPREWKGTLDGDVMVERIKGRIDERPVERARVRLPRAADKHHNVWDAVGVGLHAVGRLAPRKVFPR